MERAGGVDSDIDSEELDEEMRDKVMGGANNSSSEDEEDKEDLTQNVDLTYYSMMSADEKLMTLRNRAMKLHEKQ